MTASILPLIDGFSDLIAKLGCHGCTYVCISLRGKSICCIFIFCIHLIQNSVQMFKCRLHQSNSNRVNINYNKGMMNSKRWVWPRGTKLSKRRGWSKGALLIKLL